MDCFLLNYQTSSNLNLSLCCNFHTLFSFAVFFFSKLKDAMTLAKFMEFVVTGGAGFIGKNITNILLKDGHEVSILDNLNTGKKENLEGVLENVEFHQVDIRDYKKLEELMKNSDGVFHQAALTNVQESFTKQRDYEEVNIAGTENILKIANEFGIKVVFASSSSVYGDQSKIPIKEDSSRIPINPYGKTKLETEHLSEKYYKKGVESIGLRYFNVYGKGQNDAYAGVITKFLKNIDKGRPPIIFGSGEQTRDFIFVEDVALANIAAMKNNITNDFFNIGTGKKTSINELANLMIKLSGKDLKPIHKNPLEGDVQDSQADITKAKNLLNWNPKTELKEGLKKLLSF